MISFSIVTVTYNAESVLQPTLDSVCQQTYGAVEHIIIDGASHDATLQQAYTYRQQSAQQHTGHEVKIISEPDDGLYFAMNKGIDTATGDYILFLNAGDRFPGPDTLDMVAASVGDNETLPSVLYGDTDIVDAKGHFLRHRRLSPPERLTWKSFQMGMLVCHQAFYARTDLAKATPFDTSYRYSADVDWCIRVMKAAATSHLTLRHVHCVVALFLDGGMTTSHHRASLRERFQVMRRHYGLPVTVAMHLWFVLRGILHR